MRAKQYANAGVFLEKLYRLKPDSVNLQIQYVKVLAETPLHCQAHQEHFDLRPAYRLRMAFPVENKATDPANLRLFRPIGEMFGPQLGPQSIE